MFEVVRIEAFENLLGRRFCPLRISEEGGETEWADMRAAFDALDQDTRQRIGALRR